MPSTLLRDICKSKQLPPPPLLKFTKQQFNVNVLPREQDVVIMMVSISPLQHGRVVKERPDVWSRRRLNSGRAVKKEAQRTNWNKLVGKKHGPFFF